MANTKISTMLATTAVLALAACGGGGTSNQQGFQNSASILKSFSTDNSAVAIGKAVPGTSLGSFNAVLLVDNTNNADAHLDALYLGNNGEGTLLSDAQLPGNFYQQSVASINKHGQAVYLVYSGKNLSSGGYVSMGVSNVGTSVAVTTDGSRLVSVPAGTYQFVGAASILADDLSAGVEDGTFVMLADFNAKRATVQGQTNSKFFSSENLQINTISGQFDGTGSIGNNNGLSNSASFVGFFAGIRAEGVHGAVYTNTDYDNGQAAVFYGER